MSSDDKLSLDLLDKATVRKRARMVAIGGMMVALADVVEEVRKAL